MQASRLAKDGGRSVPLALCVAALVAAAGCESEPWDAVGSQAIAHGAVRVLAREGLLRVGQNTLVVEVVGPAADRDLGLPRLVFEKPETGSGFGLRAEAILRASGRARFRGRVELPAAGTWQATLEIGGETVSMTVSVQ